ncbi:MAG: hypothetical protein HKN26_10375 [Acidimicrobiales bacterium]|nr:hypothetical protein [Acidimicrobiales bacterium]
MKTLALALLAALAVGACGGDDDRELTADERAMVDDLADQFIADFTGVADNRLITDDEASCFGENVVRGVGLDTAEEFLEQDIADDFAMAQADADRIADALVSCVDLEALYRGGLTGLLEDEQLECAAEGLARLGADPFAQEFSGENPDGLLNDIAEDCDLPF